MYTPVTGSTVTVAPPAVVAGALYDRGRPAGSVNPADPVNLPMALSELVVTSPPEVGVPANHAPYTRIVLETVLTPLDTFTVNVSTVADVADCRCTVVGV